MVVGIRGELASVALFTPYDLSAARSFYADFGLEELSGASENQCLFRASGENHHVLRLLQSDSPGLAEVAFTVGSRAEVQVLHANYVESGVEVESEPGPIQRPGGGYGFSLVDLERRRLSIVTEREAVDPRPLGGAVPRRITHVVFNTVDIDAACAFYVDRLGFKVSDWSEHQMVFLRSGADHHSIAFNQDEHASVNHIAYEVPSLDAFLQSVGRMHRAGVEPLWGIGRHGPGNNCFAYYGDPIGFVPEFTAEVLQIDSDSWIPRVWQRVPNQSDLWGIAGPPPQELRLAMKGRADTAGSTLADLSF